MKRFLKRSGLVIVALAALGFVYEKVAESRDRKRYPQVGTSVDIGGRKLNIYCSGEGAPAVIFEGAGHTAGFAWSAIQREVAKFTRACWYDRAGYGWSDRGPSPRTFKAIAADLHALLRAVSVPAPYVLVGATAGAFHVRVYNGAYPNEVAGAVLIRATDTDVFAHEPAYMKGALNGLPQFAQKLICEVARPAMLHLGLTRILGNPGAGRPFGLANFTPPQRQELLFLSNNPGTSQTEGEGCVLEESMAEVRASGNFGDRPLSVLTGSAPFRSPEPRYEQATAALNDYWFHDLQPRLAALSTRGRLILRDDADKPEAIVDAIRDVVRDARAATSLAPTSSSPTPLPIR